MCNLEESCLEANQRLPQLEQGEKKDTGKSSQAVGFGWPNFFFLLNCFLLPLENFFLISA